MQPAIEQLLALGKLPPTDRASEGELSAFEQHILAIDEPITREEARLLSAVFGDDRDDDSFGLAWALLHKVESCGENVAAIEGVARNPWVEYLNERWRRRSP